MTQFIRGTEGPAPTPADGKEFCPRDDRWQDPETGKIFVSNGFGYFEEYAGVDMIKERPGHGLQWLDPNKFGMTGLIEFAASFGVDEAKLKNMLRARGCLIHDATWPVIDAIKEEILKTKEVQKMPVVKETTEPDDQQKLNEEWLALANEAETNGIELGMLYEMFEDLAYSEPLNFENLAKLKERVQIEIANIKLQEQREQDGTEVPVMDMQQGGDDDNQDQNQESEPDEENEAKGYTLREEPYLKAEAVPAQPEGTTPSGSEEQPKSPPPEMQPVESHGVLIDPTTGQVVGIVGDESALLELSEDDRKKLKLKKGETFSVKDESAARWVINKYRSLEHEIEKEKAIKKEYTNQCDVAVGRCETKQRGIMWKFADELNRWLKSQLRIITKEDSPKFGKYDVLSKVYTEGTLQLCEKGGPTQVNEAAFKDWWHNLPSEEIPFYGGAVTETETTVIKGVLTDEVREWLAESGYEIESQIQRSVDKDEIQKLVKDGWEIPGWANLPYDEYGAVKIIKSRKSRKASGDEQEESEGETAA